MKKILGLIIFLFFFLGILPTDVQAKRLLPHLQKASAPTGTTRTTSTTRGVSTKVKFRPDRRAIIVTFQNPSIAASLSYTLSYNSRGTTQGAGGTISTSDDNQTREIIFGTCSHGVCRYDTGITNAKFVITTTLPGGTKVVKSYRLRV